MLQEHEVRRLGETAPRSIDVRVLAATNADLKASMAAGSFRKDLYYRLNVVTLDVPPLRQRREDIPLLAHHFLVSHERDGCGKKRFGPGVAGALTTHDWPGNVRELENVIRRMVVLAPGDILTVADLPTELRSATSGSTDANGRETSSKPGEQRMIEESLRLFGGDKSKAARHIGWNRQKLYRRIKAYKIPADYGKAA